MWPFSTSKDMEKELPAPTEHATSGLGAQRILEEVEEEPEEIPPITGYANERLSIPVVLRMPILLTSSFFIGFGLGAAQGGPIAGYRYRAENAHRLPNTQTGWYLYHKSKNYHSIIGGVKEGVKMGGVLVVWPALFLVTEETIDRWRGRVFARGDDDVAKGQRDFASTVVAAMSTAGIYSWKRGLDKFTAARTAKIALKASVVFGITQDFLESLRGERPAYVDWLYQKIKAETPMAAE